MKMIDKASALQKGIQLLREQGATGSIACMHERDMAELQALGVECVMACEAERAQAVYASAALLLKEDMEKVVQEARRMGCMILAVTGNAGNITMTMGALGNALDYDEISAALQYPVFTDASMDDRFAQNGFSRAADADEGPATYQGRMTSAFEAEGAQINKSLRFIMDRTNPASQAQWLIRLYKADENAQAKERDDSLFLTVLVRTQGKRVQGLREVLLCLSAQSNMDFEVVIICHKAQEEGKENVRRLIEDCPPTLAQRLRLFELNEGGRSAPINMGFDVARGRYLAIYDDDDIITADWVEAFSRAESRSPGAILHAYCVSQLWSHVSPDGEEGLRAEGPLDNVFCRDYEWPVQCRVNHCPPVGLAFPVYLYRNMRQCFDEDLEVMEDWDFLMRMAFFCGVQDDRGVTGLYRDWKNAENSHTLYDSDYWDKKYYEILDTFREHPIMLPAGAVNTLRDLGVPAQQAQQAQPVRVLDDRLYCDGGSGWTEDNTIAVSYYPPFGRFAFSYENFSEKQRGRYLRWDPCDAGNLLIRDITCSVTDKKGVKYFFKKEDITSNGIAWGDGILFLRGDPQIYLRLPKGYVPEYMMICGEAVDAPNVGEWGEVTLMKRLLAGRLRKAAGKIKRTMKM